MTRTQVTTTLSVSCLLIALTVILGGGMIVAQDEANTDPQLAPGTSSQAATPRAPKYTRDDTTYFDRQISRTTAENAAEREVTNFDRKRSPENNSLEQRIERLEQLVERFIKQSNRSNKQLKLLPRARRAEPKSEWGQILALRIQHAKLLQNYGANHPRVMNIERQIATLERFLEVGRWTNQLTEKQAELAVKQRQLEAIQADIRRIEQQIVQLKAQVDRRSGRKRSNR